MKKLVKILSAVFCISLLFFFSAGFTSKEPRWIVYKYAALYGFNYDLNTLPDLEKPYNYLNNANTGFAFRTYKLENKNVSHIRNETMENGEKFMNAHVIMFAGHGKAGGARFYDGYLMSSELNNMNSVDFVIWASCNSAQSQVNLKSLGQASVDAGALSAIGFPETINNSSAKTFTDRIFKKLSEGESVASAANYAKNGLWWLWDNARDYVIFGNGNTTITEYNKNRNALNSLEFNNLKTRFENDIKNGNWEIIETSFNNYRYYKTINGLLTDIFYDVEFDESRNIKNITCSKTQLNDDIEILPKNNIQSRFNENDVNQNISNVNIYNVYVTIDNKMVPVELKYFDLLNEQGFKTQEVVCTNLNDFTTLDYSDINSCE